MFLDIYTYRTINESYRRRVTLKNPLQFNVSKSNNSLCYFHGERAFCYSTQTHYTVGYKLKISRMTKSSI